MTSIGIKRGEKNKKKSKKTLSETDLCMRKIKISYSFFLHINPRYVNGVDVALYFISGLIHHFIYLFIYLGKKNMYQYHLFLLKFNFAAFNCILHRHDIKI